MVADIGTHAHHLTAFITGLEVAELSAELATFVPRRRVVDNAQIGLRFANGARGSLWVSFVAAGNEHGLRIRVFGTKGGLDWRQEHPNHLVVNWHGRPAEIVTRAGPGLAPEAKRATRLAVGHPEGYFEAFANLYSDIADAIVARRTGAAADPPANLFPTVEDGARGMKFVEAALESHAKGGAWIDATLAL